MHIFEYILVLVRPQTDCLLFIHNQAKVMLERALECKFVVLSRISTHHYLTKKSLKVGHFHVPGTQQLSLHCLCIGMISHMSIIVCCFCK